MRTQQQIQSDRLIAQRLFIHNEGHMSGELSRDSCGACALEGYISRSTREQLNADGIRHRIINYAGWLRVYIQAGRFIKHQFKNAVIEELKSTNWRYLNAFIEDVSIYGISADAEIKKIIEDWVNQHKHMEEPKC